MDTQANKQKAQCFKNTTDSTSNLTSNEEAKVRLPDVENSSSKTCSSYNSISDSTLRAEEENLLRNKRMGDSSAHSLKPTQALKTLNFHAVFFFSVSTGYALILKANFYKQFALLYIPDDRYLTLVGTLLPIVAAGSRLCVGAALNKRVVSIKVAIIFGLSINGFLCAFWYFVPQVQALLYFPFSLGLGVVQSLCFVIIPVACLELFGPAHFSTNYGLLLSSLVVVGLLSPVVIELILHTLGWFWLFESASALLSISLLIVVCADFKAINLHLGE